MWSRKYEKCLLCGTTDHHYRANGFCTLCHFRGMYKNPKFRKKWKKIVSNWKLNNKKRVTYLQYRAMFKFFLKHYPEDAKQIINNLTK